MCPAAYHLQSCGLDQCPSWSWRCPHHKGCCECGKRSDRVGFLFRCEMCPNAYCEDCLPGEYDFCGGTNEFWVPLGFDKIQSTSCYIHCSQDCKDFYTTQKATMKTYKSPAKGKKSKGKG